jgi:tetratricopeptide (TPR) repeat protein
MVRRCSIALFALAISTILLRNQIALALVYRGDDAMSRADVGGAAGYYRRALFLDPASSIAADRVSFASFLADDPSAMRAALSHLDEVIVSDPTDLDLRRDRALLEMRLKKFGAALEDFAVIGGRERDARALAFAGILGSRSRECGAAHRLFVRALELDPRLEIARRRLGRPC